MKKNTSTTFVTQSCTSPEEETKRSHQENRLLKKRGFTLALIFTFVALAWSFCILDFHQKSVSSTITLLGVLGGIGMITIILEERYISSTFKQKVCWFLFGYAPIFFLATQINPIYTLLPVIGSRVISQKLGEKQEKAAAFITIAANFAALTVLVSVLKFAGFGVLSNLWLIVPIIGIAASLEDIVGVFFHGWISQIAYGKEKVIQPLQGLRLELKRNAVFNLGYATVVALIAGMYFTAGITLTAIVTAMALGWILTLKLLDQQRRKTLGEQPVSWNLASMVFKVLHTNQDRFVRHSLATGRLSEMVAKELKIQLGDTAGIDSEESWVIGVLHDVALMDQPTQVLRFAERVERPIDLEMYEEKKEGGRLHLNLVDHRYPKVTSEDTHVLDEHPKIGAQLLAGWPNVAEIIERHHTFSTDYDQLPLLAQILFVCEKYELLASENGYYTTVSKDEAIDAIREEYESIQEHPQVLNALITVLHNHDETFWNATDLDYDQEVQMIATRLKVYADKQTQRSASGQPKQTELKPLHHPLAQQPHHPARG